MATKPPRLKKNNLKTNWLHRANGLSGPRCPHWLSQYGRLLTDNEVELAKKTGALLKRVTPGVGFRAGHFYSWTEAYGWVRYNQSDTWRQIINS